MPAETTQVLAEFAATLTYDKIPERVREYLQGRAVGYARLRRGGSSGRRDPPARGAVVGAGAVEREHRDRRRSPVARRRHHAQRLSHHRRHDVRRPPSHADAYHARSRPSGIGDRGARRALRPRPAGGDRRRLRGHDAGRCRDRLSGLPRPRLAWARRVRSVRGGRRGRPPAPLRRRDHGAGVRARRQPGRRHLRGLGHADGQVPPVPGRAVRPDGGAAGRAEIRRHPRVPHRARRRPLQQLLRTAGGPRSPPPISAAAGSSSRSRCACGRPRPRSRA